jgi:hypothetical protein
LRATLAELGADFSRQVSAIECHSGMCRLATEHSSAAASIDFMDQMETRPGLQGSRFVRIRTAPGTESYEYFVEPRQELGAVHGE